MGSQLDIERLGAALRRAHDRRGAGVRGGDVVGLRLPQPEQRREHDDERDDEDRDPGADQERALADALGELAAGDQADGLGPHAATARRNRSVSVGRSRLKWVTVPAARAASSTSSGVAPSLSATTSAPSRPRASTSARGTRASQASPPPETDTRSVRSPL